MVPALRKQRQVEVSDFPASILSSRLHRETLSKKSNNFPRTIMNILY